MKWIIITYVYRRFDKWYLWRYVTRTRLMINDITKDIFEREIQKEKEKVNVKIIDIEYE